MKNKLKNLILIILIIAVLVGIGFLVFNAVRSVNYNKNAKKPILKLDVAGYGEVQIELEPDYAPNTVATIVKLAQNGYYDGKLFYGTDSKVVGAGMYLKTETVEDEQTEENQGETAEETQTEETQAEDTTKEAKTKKVAAEDETRVSDFDKSVTPFISEDDENYATTDKDKIGNEETDYKVSIDGEFVANGFNDNTLRFEKGTVGLFRQNYSGGSGENLTKESYNSGSSLFFITTEEDSSLNGEYAAFGKVIKGMDIIEKMLALPTEDDDSNSSAGDLGDNGEIKKFAEGSYPVIDKVTVDTFGIDYGMPKYTKAFDYNKYMSDLLMRYYNNQ